MPPRTGHLGVSHGPPIPVERIQVVTLDLVALGMGLTSEGAGRSVRSREIPEAPQNTMSSAPIIGHRVDREPAGLALRPNGGVLRARVSTAGPTTNSVGISSVLKE